MFQQTQKFKILISNSLNKYIQTPISDRIIPFIGFSFYIFMIPQILTKIIPTSQIFQNYFDAETAKTIIYIICLTLSNSLTVTLYSTFMYFVYTKKILFLQNYRINPKKQWPWQQNAQKWNILLKKTVKVLLINTMVVGLFSLSIQAFIFQRKVNLDPAQIPSYTTIIWQFTIFLVVQDFTSTCTHTLLHQPSFYWIHKKHHQYTTTISISAQYAHPIQFIFSNSIPTIIGFKVLAYFCSVHIVSAVTWLIFRILLTSDLHSGYQFPWDFYRLIPLSSPASYHDFHHSHNVGNYASSFMFIEALFGTNKQYYKYIKQNINKIANQKIKQKLNPQKMMKNN